jgi:hypothetical protein
MHFVYKDTLLDILAYEGSFVGTTAPSTGLTFPDIGVCENPDSPDTCSIYLSGFKGSEWVYGKASPGCCNPGQCLIDQSTALNIEQFRAKRIQDKIIILWSSGNEADIKSYKLYKNGVFLAEIDKNENGKYSYSYCDNSEPYLSKHQYLLSSIHLSGNETILDTLECSLPALRGPSLGKPFPNPFNPYVEIPFSLSEKSAIEINIYNLSGKSVYSYTKPEQNIGNHTIKIDMSDQVSGTYFISFKNGEKTAVKKLSLVK